MAIDLAFKGRQLDVICKKASELLRDETSICMVPGGNTKDLIVKSSTGSQPHLVTAKKIGQYACDSESPCGDQQSRFRNVYYHCNVACIQSCCSEFTPQILVVPPMIAV